MFDKQQMMNRMNINYHRHRKQRIHRISGGEFIQCLCTFVSMYALAFSVTRTLSIGPKTCEVPYLTLRNDNHFVRKLKCLGQGHNCNDTVNTQKVKKPIQQMLFPYTTQYDIMRPISCYK